jgi:hypothetical protein
MTCESTKIHELKRHYSALKRNKPAFHGTIKRAAELRLQRNANKPTGDALGDTLRRRLTCIPAGSCDTEYAVQCLMRQPANARKGNWDRQVHALTILSRRHIRLVTINHGRYSSRCRYDRLSYRPETRSCGIVTTRRLLWFFGPRSGMIHAGRGWQFGCDSVGLYVVKSDSRHTEDRCHFTTDDMRNWSTLRKAALQHVRQQRALRSKAKSAATEAQRQAKLEAAARKAGILVAWHDNRMAGNCFGGSSTWCQQHGIDPRRPVRLEVLERLQDTHPLVRRACQQAISRAVRELRAGFGTVMPPHIAEEIFAH